jgi:hypothetical protein
MHDINWTYPTATEDADILERASAPTRACLLREAEALTVGERNRTYGDPVENMQHIADIFNAWTGRDITAREVAQLHTATNMARSQTTPDHRDSYVDSMAYRGIEFECAAAKAGEGAE